MQGEETDQGETNSFVQPPQPQPPGGTDISRISVKIPPLWRKNIKIWRLQVDAQFGNLRIVNEHTKFNYILATLDTDIADLISDFLCSPLSDTPYTDLMERIQNEFQESDGVRARKLLTDLELGDKKPTQLLREMKTLAGNQVSDDFLKSIFLQRLPANVRTILAPSKDNLANLACIADKIVEYSAPVYGLNSITTKPTDLEKRIAKIESQLAVLCANSQSNTTRGRSLDRSHTNRGRSPSAGSNKWCWYHRTFGTKATKCVSPCSFTPALNDPPQ